MRDNNGPFGHTAWKSAKRAAIALLAKVPIYGHLVYAQKKCFRGAAGDLVVTTIFSLFPIWFYPLVTKIGYGLPFWDNAISFANDGELFLYSAALVGPLIYSITKNYSDDEDEKAPNAQNGKIKKYNPFPRLNTIKFPYGSWFVIISIFICLFAAFLFGTLRLNATPVLSTPPDRETLFTASIFIYLFTISCFYCVNVYRLSLEDTSQKFGQDTDELFEDWIGNNG